MTTDHARTRAQIQADIADARAKRAALKLQPGTHGEQDRMLVGIDLLLDQLLDAEPEPA